MEHTSAAPKPTPRSTKSGEGKESSFEETMYQRNLFLNMALNMTWQLALVVIIPIVGGYKLDQHTHTAPLWTIVGAVVAALGMAGVMVRIVRVAAVRSAKSPADSDGSNSAGDKR